MKIYDLRSDTITLQTPQMREAMYHAEVGDDVYGEDKTVNTLEAMARELSGKEDSVFVSSGCMGNLLSLMIYGGRGNEVLCSKESHIIQHEIGAVSAIANTIPITVDSVNGIIDETTLENYIRPYSYDMGKSAMIEVENTTSGLIYPLEKMQKIKAIAEKHNMKVHLDGARIFNAVVETGIPLSTWAKCADDVTFCLSKGLGCPVGSMLCGDKEFIHLARRYRKMLGGGMRQIGYLAAAGIYALNNHVERLKEDHDNCKLIKEAIESTSWARVLTYGTNILFFTSDNYDINKIVKKFNADGLLVLSECGACRVVTNIGISKQDAEEIANYIKAFDPESINE
ncbi:MAG: GntG family PLP-dependent aldolase [Spirochaetales bacterium]|uniref:threonine aldolase family protein n=1 Tax=Bullifex sp. TaxID=2815808 RepID=UPI002A561C59|nr:GntG family PLP-dependent aldolase [Bullifex sp.]MDD7271504.1 GntG family PLP-dependent aldolase [Spirochaetales bacterium]MDY4066891.1 GntG family PLP-dependent aldolase [Bullifex sp.]